MDGLWTQHKSTNKSCTSSPLCPTKHTIVTLSLEFQSAEKKSKILEIFLDTPIPSLLAVGHFSHLLRHQDDEWENDRVTEVNWGFTWSQWNTDLVLGSVRYAINMYPHMHIYCNGGRGGQHFLATATFWISSNNPFLIITPFTNMAKFSTWFQMWSV